MQRIALLTIRMLAVAALVVLLIVAVVWPWPAPAVDWRTPVEAAMSKRDCGTFVKMLDAAVSAGSTEAMRFRAKAAANSPCYGGDPSMHRDNENAELVEEARGNGPYATVATLYHLTQNDLGYWRNRYVAGVIFLCAAPYNALHSIDHTELSKTVIKKPTIVQLLHQQRRNFCIRALAWLANELIESADAASREIAHNLLTKKPSIGDARSAVLLATLVLAQGFVRKSNKGQEPLGVQMRETDRQVAWSLLEQAAEEGNEDAIRMMITLLHEGRFRARDDRNAYFWLLRLRRFGKTHESIDTAVEGALTDVERNEMKQREEIKWSMMTPPNP